MTQIKLLSIEYVTTFITESKILWLWFTFVCLFDLGFKLRRLSLYAHLGARAEIPQIVSGYLFHRITQLSPQREFPPSSLIMEFLCVSHIYPKTIWYQIWNCFNKNDTGGMQDSIFCVDFVAVGIYFCLLSH